MGTYAWFRYSVLRHTLSLLFNTAITALGLFLATTAHAAITCERHVTADIVAMDQPLLWNRLGAATVNGMMFALRRDVVQQGTLLPEAAGGVLAPGQVQLRPDKRPRPLVLRVRRGDCLAITLTNLLDPVANPLNLMPPQFNVFIDEQVAERNVSFQVAGMQWLNGPEDDATFVGQNLVNGSVSPNTSRTYHLYAEFEGVFMARGMASVVGSDANQGNSSNGLFGQVIVEPKLARTYRSTLTEEEMRLVAMDLSPASPTCGAVNLNAARQPIIDYDARYPTANCNVAPGGTGVDLGAAVWAAEGKAGLPILDMIDPATNEIVHTAIDAIVAGSNADGTFLPSTYPLESMGKRNPTVPNRLEPFRDFASVWHDETAAAQAFPGFYETDPVFNYVLAGVRDSFMINYGSGGIGSEIIANRLGVGPMHDCESCEYEEFFLTAFTVGDPAQLVDVSANIGLEALLPGQLPPVGTTGPKATMVPYPDDVSNVHHSYTGDFVKFRNTHVGKEQHVFHLHNHQWLYNPNDDNSNYLDAQGLGPGVGYTYEINFGGSGNRNKTAGDAIFHCHFYPHFAQGMWYMWRNHDVLETGTLLEVSGGADGFHNVAFALEDGTPALHPNAGVGGIPADARVRALPDGEVVAGAPIPAVVPLPGKAMAPLPEEVVLVPNTLTTTASVFHPHSPGGAVPVGSLARVVGGRDANPGYPFWIAGIEDVVGQRPPTPPLDMITNAQVAALKALPVDDRTVNGVDLWADIDPAQADGWDGGLPRAAMQGYAAGGMARSTESALDFSKHFDSIQGVFYPEEGTDIEQVAMAFHAQREHASCLPDGTCDPSIDGASTTDVKFVVNGLPPAIGAPYHEPCLDDNGVRMGDGVIGNFFSGESLNDPKSITGSSFFTADNPRIYKGVDIQFDVVLNKAGYHYPQQRIITLWEDAVPVIEKTQAPEPFVLRFNTFDCGVYHHANLVPTFYEMDDYQVRTPTDIIGQHIHLPKWDLTTADGAANGWNYEDGTLSPQAVQDRIHALNCYVDAAQCSAGIAGGVGSHRAGIGAPPGFTVPGASLAAAPHPYFNSTLLPPGGLSDIWLGARTTQQRWFFDPVVNTEGVDRGLGIIFTHDHYGPSTHQQIGLYATVLTEPAGSTWLHNETGEQLGQAADGSGGRADGGPTSWQAVILPPTTPPGGSNVGAENLAPFREFYFEYSDFQHAYEAGVYVGADQWGQPLGETLPGVPTPGFALNTGNPDFSGDVADAFRFAINPPARTEVTPVFPDLLLEAEAGILPGCPTRPCPQAIDVDDPGLLAVNYRNEPVGLRVYDPNAIGPDGKPGAQSVGDPGDLALALESRTDRRFEIPNGWNATFGTITPTGRQVLNAQPAAGDSIAGTLFPPPLNAAGLTPGDPFTPMMRSYAGDLVRVKMQAGGDEEEHNGTVHGVKWLQAGSSHGKAPNSGWRGGQAGGISEQFTLTTPVVPLKGNLGRRLDYLYSMDVSQDGWWSGMWGILRAYESRSQSGGTLHELPNNIPQQTGIVEISNAADFDGACPVAAPARAYDVTAVLANDVLPANADVTIQDICPGAECAGAGHVGVAPDPAGGTLVYNPRTDQVGGQVVIDEETGQPVTLPAHNGPIHDPTAVIYVHTADLITDIVGNPVGLKPNTPVEPLILRAAAGDCIKLTLRNGLPNLMPDLPTYSALLGVVKRDRHGLQGSTTFLTNLIQTSSRVGLHPQMVTYDVSLADGTVVGENKTFAQVVATNNPPGEYEWYAGDIDYSNDGPGLWTLTATPIEFGTSNLQPADKIKQGMKSAVGQLVIEPLGSTWIEDGVNVNEAVAANDPARYSYAPGATRTQASVAKADGSSFRDFSVVMTKGQTHHYADSSPVEHVNGEGDGIPEDSQEVSGMAINYGIEPAWFRLGILPQSPFGGALTPGSFGELDQDDLFHNSKVGGDPATPVFLAQPGQPARMRVAVPHGSNRGSTFALHGHLWQRDPYVCLSDPNDPLSPLEARNGLVGACLPDSVGSEAIGNNPQGFYQGGQESIWSTAHFDVVLPSAGGGNGITGDYLFRDVASFGTTSGLWGIMRVEDRPDSDGDGVFDDIDNCINVPNGPSTPNVGFSQRDTDGDGFGNVCDTDLTNGSDAQDPITNFIDLGLFGAAFAPSVPVDPLVTNADFNGDGFVDFLDYGIFGAFFMQPPGPSCCGTALP